MKVRLQRIVLRLPLDAYLGFVMMAMGIGLLYGMLGNPLGVYIGFIYPIASYLTWWCVREMEPDEAMFFGGTVFFLAMCCADLPGALIIVGLGGLALSIVEEFYVWLGGRTP